MRTLKILGPVVLVAAVAAGCAGAGTGSPAATEAASDGAPAGGAGAVSIVDFGFEPADLSVVAGTMVTWSNTGDATHSVKWGDGTQESPRLASGDTYERTFDAAGTFPYACGIHGSMAGTITVTE